MGPSACTSGSLLAQNLQPIFFAIRHNNRDSQISRTVGEGRFGVII